jgi:hypothetical protein
MRNKFTDYLAFKSADFIFLETEAQVERHLNSKLWSKSKFFSIFSGFNETSINVISDNRTKIAELDLLPKERKLIFFRGKYNLESGIDLIANAIQYCNETTYLLVVTNTPATFTHPRIIWINRYISAEELQKLYKLVDICIGQMGVSPRLEFTLAHKIFEAAYHGKSILLQDTAAVRELIDKSAYDFLIKSPTPQKIASELEKCLSDILRLSRNNEVLREIYVSKSQQKILGKKFDQLVLQNL